MKIANKTRKTTITNDAGYTDSFPGRFRGLMLTRRKDLVLAGKKDSVLESTIHMMNMLYPLDVIWANENMEVVDVKRDVPPFNPLKPKTWKTYAPGKAAKYVIELGTTKAEGTIVGDKLEFVKS